MEIGQIIHNKYIFNNNNKKKTSELKSGRWFRLALLHIHYNIEIDLDEIIRQFARLHLGKMELANILSEWLRNPGEGTLGSSNPKKIPGETCPPTGPP